MIYISVLAPFRCEYVQLNVESEEKAEFTRFWTEFEQEEGDDGQIRTVAKEKSERCEESREGFDFKAKLLDMAQYNNTFQPGNYCI